MGDLLEVYAIFDQIEAITVLCIEGSKSEKEADDLFSAIKTLANTGYSKLQAVEAASRNTVAK